LSKRFLVTTSLQNTWNPEEKNYFLGEWCKLYSQSSVWEKLDYEVIPYHWEDRGKLRADYEYISLLYENLLSKLSVKLNEIHGTDYSNCYWRIVIGPWLGFFLQSIFDRWSMLKIAVNELKVNSCFLIKQNIDDHIPIDMSDFNKSYINDSWNEAVCGQLIELLYKDIIDISYVKKLEKKIKPPITSSILSKVRNSLIKNFNKLIGKNSEYFFLSNYLPFLTNIVLQFRLDQIPRFWYSIESEKIKISSKLRKKLNINGSHFDDFGKIAAKLIPNHMPSSYLEGYKGLSLLGDNLGWPKNPSVIFTSVAHEYDDVFKIWAAEKKEQQSKLITIQHGGHMGMSPWAFYEDHQLKVSDKFISWGWMKDEFKNIVPIGNPKTWKQKLSYDRTGALLTIQMALPRYSYHMYAVPVAGQWLDYFKDQKSFVRNLPENIQKKLLLRLYRNDYGWDQKLRWKSFDPSINFDAESNSMYESMKKCRLFVSSYNATTHLESLSMNIPTIMFWNPKHWELLDEVRPYFDLLRSVGIFHESPESAAKQVALVWDNIESWWYDDELQGARKLFCKKYSSSPSNFEDQILKCLLELSN